MRRFISALLLITVFTNTDAQQQANGTNEIQFDGKVHCGFDAVLQREQVSQADYIDYIIAPRVAAAKSAASRGVPMAKTTDGIYRIPVVFHIVYDTAHPNWNIPDSVIFNQVEILNKAFRKQHADTGNTRSYFKPLSTDAGIEFYLATKDPQGKPTNGITRTISKRYYFANNSYTTDSLEMLKQASKGGADKWPTEKYLNIWVGNLANSAGVTEVLAYATPPLDPPPGNWPPFGSQFKKGVIDGVAIQTHAVGSNSVLNAQMRGIYAQGRCLVHEVGHYLGLLHIFGFNMSNASCGSIADDGIGDTPTQSSASMENTCPSSSKNTCGAGTAGDLPDMWENYMDYTKDACQNMFTQEQVAVMRAVLSEQRASLTGYVPNSVASIPRALSVAVYPNPVSNTLSVAYAGKIDHISIHNFMGQRVLQQHGDYRTIDISSLPTGNYILSMEADNKRMVSKFDIIR